MLCGLPGSNNKPLYHCLGYANEAEQKADEHLFPSMRVREEAFLQPKDTFRKTFILYEKDFPKELFRTNTLMQNKAHYII